MASKKLTNDESSTELNFQDFSKGDGTTSVTSDDFSLYADSPNLNEEAQGLLRQEEETPSSFWQFRFYQSFFRVNTKQVLQRMLWSMIPLPGRATFLDRQIKPPDLYGPFWICTTLVFSIAISASISDYLLGRTRDKRYHYNFHNVSLAATAIYSYAFLIPLAIWGLIWYRRSSTKYTLLEILCVYGYSLFIYIPISILWVIQVTWLQWLLVFIGASLSGLVLLQTFSPIVKDESRKVACIILSLIMLLHVLLAVGFVLYFFHAGESKTLVAPVQPSDLESTASMKNLSTEIATTVKQMIKENVSTHNISQKENLSVILNSTKKM